MAVSIVVVFAYIVGLIALWGIRNLSFNVGERVVYISYISLVLMCMCLLVVVVAISTDGTSSTNIQNDANSQDVSHIPAVDGDTLKETAIAYATSLNTHQEYDYSTLENVSGSVLRRMEQNDTKYGEYLDKMTNWPKERVIEHFSGNIADEPIPFSYEPTEDELNNPELLAENYQKALELHKAMEESQLSQTQQADIITQDFYEVHVTDDGTRVYLILDDGTEVIYTGDIYDGFLDPYEAYVEYSYYMDNGAVNLVNIVDSRGNAYFTKLYVADGIITDIQIANR